MHNPRCSVYLDICHVNSCEVGATHSRCCMLQCVHYSMERGDAELISMATGLNDRTRAKENFQLAAEAFQKGAAAVRSACPAAQVCVVCEAPVAVVVFKCNLPACALSRSVGGKTADVCSSGCTQDGGCSDRPHITSPITAYEKNQSYPCCYGGWCCLTTSWFVLCG